MPPSPLDSDESSRSGLTTRTLSGVLWTGSGTGIKAALQIGVFAVLARLLTPQEFGQVAAALVVIGFSDVFVRLGVGPAIVQRRSLERRHLETGFAIAVFMGVAFGAGVWLLADPIAVFFRIPGLAPIVRALAFIFPVSSLAIVPRALLNRQLQFRTMAKIDVASYTFGYTVVGITMAWLGYGVWALVGAQLAEALVATILAFSAEPQPRRIRFDVASSKELLLFGGGHTAIRLSNFFAVKGDYLVVGRWLGASALGFYERAYRLMSVPALLLGTVFDSVLFPMMARVQDDVERLTTAYRRSVALVALVVLPISAATMTLAPELIRVFLGPGWSEAVVPFQILVLGMYFRAGYRVSNSLIQATGAVYRGAWRQGLYAVAVVAGALVGQVWGLPGVAAGVVVAVLLIFLLNAHLGIQLTRLSWTRFWYAHLPGLALAVTVVGATWGIASLLRGMDAAPLLVLAAAASFAGAVVLMASRWWPAPFLGEDGEWMMRTLMHHLRVRLPGWRGKAG